MNKSGITPVEYKVLVRPERVEEKTAGGIILPDEVREKEQFSAMRGVLVEAGEIAFTNPNWLKTPKAGDTIYFDRYANGAEVEGADGEKYWLMNDKSIIAISEG